MWKWQLNFLMWIFVCCKINFKILCATFIGHAIEGCSSDSPVDVDPAPLFFKCVDLTPDQHVSWHLLKRDGSNNDEISLLNVAVCLRGEFCSSLLTGAAAERSDDGSSVLKIFSPAVLESLSITCRAFDSITTYSTTYMTDYTCNLAIRSKYIDYLLPLNFELKTV